MKRVNEVFELPVDEMDICEAVDHYSEEKDAAIVRAINHVDALADALADLIEESKNYAANFKSEYYGAIDALEDYRGKP
jgi:hypothetical protein